MNKSNQKLINKFENIINKLITDFRNFHEDYFFTEKEIHSYFYHLCVNAGKFVSKNKFSLIHTEYPTPFKCKKDPNKYLDYASINEDKMRSHIDIVLINPNFVEWVYSNRLDARYIIGLANDIFSKYILEFANIYESFQNAVDEPILLYAIEFKYFRHSYTGKKYPLIEVNYDLAKLDLLKNKNFEINGKKIHFCFKTRSIVFIGHRIKNDFYNMLNSIKHNDLMIIR